LVRKILAIGAAATVGVLTTMAFASPASANTVKPVAAYTNSCANGKVSISIGTTGDEAVKFKILSANGTDIAGGTAANGTAITKATSPKKYEDTTGGNLVLQWKNAAGTWVEAQPAHKWTFDAAKCGLQFSTVAPTCDNPKLTVKVSNPNSDGVAGVQVGFKRDELRLLDKGGITTFTSTGDITVWYGESNGQYGNKTFDFVAPTGCDAPVVEQQNAVIVVADANTGGNGGGKSGGAQAAGAGQSDDSLPVTGSPVRTVLLAGAVMMVLGVVGLLIARRRRAIRFTSAG
jgi:LPXTG-motif cell wall-anchored protein